MQGALSFLGQAARHWRETGAIAPSGAPLARTMVRSIGYLRPQDVIVELGPGTGVFTRELLRRYPGHQVVAVEFNPAFITKLRMSEPRATVVEGCASQLPLLLSGLGIDHSRVGAVVSGLPLLSLGPDLCQRVLEAITRTLRPGGRYVQFTYSKARWDRKLSLHGFEPERTKRVWLNMPPAVVMPFRRAS